MSLLKELVKETAAAGVTSAHASATVPGSLFGGGVVDADRSKKKGKKMLRRAMNLMGEAIAPASGETKFDAAGVLSKIDAAEKKAKTNDDTVAFGLEDEEGGIVKVYVKQDQAEEFEKALSMALSGEDEDEDDENTSTEIAQVIFKLKDRFEIIDVEWTDIEGDEDEEQEVEDGEAVETGDEEGGMEADKQGDPEAEGMEGGDELDVGGEVADAAADESDTKSALQDVIDVMKADAAAKTAEANAKEAEAKAKEAEYTAQASASKVQQEEKILDMETYNKEQTDLKKETDQLAKLAKFQHDTATKAETTLSKNTEIAVGEGQEEDEEEGNHGITTSELSSLIMRNLRAN